MNISDPLWNSPPLANASSNFTLSANGTDSLGLAQNQTHSIIDALSTSGAHLFTLKEFLYIGFSLTAITLGFPLLGVKIFRSTVRFINRHVSASFYVLFFLVICSIGVTNSYFPSLTKWGVTILEVAFGTVMLLYKAEPLSYWHREWTRRWKKKWMAFIALVAVAISSPAFILLPLAYLIIYEISASMRPFFASHPFSKDTDLPIPPLKRKYFKLGMGLLAAICVVLSVSSPWIPLLQKPSIVSAFGMYASLYGIDNFLAALRLRRARVEWGGFLISVGVSAIFDLLFYFSVTLPTVPLVYRILVCLYVNDQEFITKYLPEWMNSRRRKLSGSSA